MLSQTPEKNIFKSFLKKGEDSLYDFWQKSRNEIKETGQAGEVFEKYIGGKDVTNEEKEILKSQTFDMVKIVFIGVPLAVIPGFSLLMVLIVKVGRKYNINVLPSSFASPPKESNNSKNMPQSPKDSKKH